MAVKVIWTGSSGKKYDFEAFPVGTQFNHVSAVYIACRRMASGNFEALYVGETQSLYNRLNAGSKNHSGLICAARNGMTHIAVRLTPGDTQRLRVETDLRHGLEPSCNKQSVSTQGKAFHW